MYNPRIESLNALHSYTLTKVGDRAGRTVRMDLGDHEIGARIMELAAIALDVQRALNVVDTKLTRLEG